MLALAYPCISYAHSVDNVIPRPQKVRIIPGTYHHNASDVINVKYNSRIPEEGYILRVRPGGVTVEASSSSGVFYAGMTLRQMSGGLLEDIDNSEWTVDCCTVKDAPRFGYRGLHLDVSRHFRSREFVLKQLDAMAAVKLNRLHLHLTDGAGWRLQIDSFPLLTDSAAWRTSRYYNDWVRGDRHYSDSTHGYGGFYTKDDIRLIVSYAAARHITVIPEIEIPGHSSEVCAVYPQFSCSGVPYTNGDVCPGKEETFEFFEKVLDEVIELFPSEYIHIGGDEAGKRAWKTCPDCQRRIREEGLKDVDELQSYTIRRIERYVESKGRHIIGWDEIIDGGLAPNATVMSWRGVEGGIKASALGHDAIMSPQKYCYIDAAQDRPDKEPAAYGAYLPLDKVYEYDPTDGMPDPSHIIGLQANLWSEYITSDEYAEYMYWPRALAIAEVGWTRPEHKQTYAGFRKRALGINGLMRNAGYNAFDLETEAGNRPEYGIRLNHLALGAKVSYNGGSRWRDAYPAAAEATFTDGLKGGWSYRDDRWQGFVEDIDVTIDLGEVKDLTMVEAEFYCRGREMEQPRRIRVELSSDGVDFVEAAVIESPSPAESASAGRGRRRDVSFSTAKADFEPSKARYVRFRTEREGFGGWFFLDEIVVR